VSSCSREIKFDDKKLTDDSRWIRLLFGREFPFEQVLSLWDTIFAYDPSLELIDFICIAMLLRIRWKRKTVPIVTLLGFPDAN
jgi:hypothetical protein